MLFDPFESIVLFLSVLTVNYVVQDGKSNWLEGMILICLCVPPPDCLSFETEENVDMSLWLWCSGSTPELS